MPWNMLYIMTENMLHQRLLVIILNHILKSESLGYLDRIKIANKIMTDHVSKEANQNLRYNVVKLKKNR